MTKQYCFFFDPTRCVNCRSCELACQASHSLPPNLRPRRMLDIWRGTFPNTRRRFLSLSCLHCLEPACVEACPAEAVTKREEDGIVVVNRQKCVGCGLCLKACPYDVPQFDHEGIMYKCDFCVENGTEPACVRHCPTEALLYGTWDRMKELEKRGRAHGLTGDTRPCLWMSEVEPMLEQGSGRQSQDLR